MSTSVGSIHYDLSLDKSSFDKHASDVRRDVDGLGKSSKKVADDIGGLSQSLRNNWQALAGVAVGAGVGFHQLTGFIDNSVTAANRLHAALTGLSSVSRAFGVDQKAATKAAKELATDGLMTVADAATGLKNLLATGFSLDQAITLMKRFKDSASFGRQSALSFGQAVTSATEGIKNGNSILVDNAGVTKNLSIMLEEAGLSSQDLMKATTDASVRQAIFNGILKETNAQSGDAARLTESFAGKQAQASAQTEVLYQRIGVALQPALLALLQTVTPLIEKFARFTEQNPGLVAGIVLISTVSLGLIFTLGTLGLAIAGLGPVWTLMAATGVAAMTGLGVAFRGLAALVASPLIMPAIAVAAALASLNQVWNAVQSVRTAISDMQNAAAAAQSYDMNMRDTAASMRRLQKSGDAAQRARATAWLKNYPGFASGGFTGTGGAHEIAGVVHKGEYVVPREQVDQRTGMPQWSGAQTTINLNMDGIMARSRADLRDIGKDIVGAINEELRAKNMPQLGAGAI